MPAVLLYLFNMCEFQHFNANHAIQLINLEFITREPTHVLAQTVIMITDQQYVLFASALVQLVTEELTQIV